MTHHVRDEVTRVIAALDMLRGIPGYSDLAEALFDRMTTNLRSSLLSALDKPDEPSPVPPKPERTEAAPPPAPVPSVRKRGRISKLAGVDIEAEIAKHGSVKEAAKAIGVEPSTLFNRRLAVNPGYIRQSGARRPDGMLAGVDIEAAILKHGGVKAAARALGVTKQAIFYRRKTAAKAPAAPTTPSVSPPSAPVAVEQRGSEWTREDFIELSRLWTLPEILHVDEIGRRMTPPRSGFAVQTRASRWGLPARGEGVDFSKGRVRDCMSCQQPFWSSWSGNRRCPKSNGSDNGILDNSVAA